MSEQTDWKIILYPFATVCIALLPVLEAVLQIEFNSNNSIAIHWRILIAASIGGILGAVAQTLKRFFNIKEEDLLKENEKLMERINILNLEHQLTEREIMINSLLLNEKWTKQNNEIRNLRDLEARLKVKENSYWGAVPNNFTKEE